MATKLSPTENMKIIAQISEKNGIDPCFMIAKAKIESTLNNLAKNGSYWGLFQLGNGVGGVTGNDRLDSAKATQGAINYLKYNKSQFEKKFSGQWRDEFGYLMHQQGADGFMDIYGNPKTLIKGSRRERAIRNNTKKGWNQTTYKDFVNNWTATFNDLRKQCSKEIACLGIGEYSYLADPNACGTGLNPNTGIKSGLTLEAQKNNYTIVGLALAAIAATYAYKNYGKKLGLK